MEHTGLGRSTTEVDIYRSETVLVNHHGEDTPIEAAMRADAILEAGDLDGYAVWKRSKSTLTSAKGRIPEQTSVRLARGKVATSGPSSVCQRSKVAQIGLYG